jgi:hypothetical protein
MGQGVGCPALVKITGMNAYSLLCHARPENTHLIPFLMAQVVNITRSGKSRPASIGDDDVEATELCHSLLDDMVVVFCSKSVLFISSVRDFSVTRDCVVPELLFVTYPLYNTDFHGIFFLQLVCQILSSFNV